MPTTWNTIDAAVARAYANAAIGSAVQPTSASRYGVGRAAARPSSSTRAKEPIAGLPRSIWATSCAKLTPRRAWCGRWLWPVPPAADRWSRSIWPAESRCCWSRAAKTSRPTLAAPAASKVAQSVDLADGWTAHVDRQWGGGARQASKAEFKAAMPNRWAAVPGPGRGFLRPRDLSPDGERARGVARRTPDLGSGRRASMPRGCWSMAAKSAACCGVPGASNCRRWAIGASSRWKSR